MRGDAQGMVDMYTENGAIFPSGRPIIKGRADYGVFRALNSRDGQTGNPGYGKYVMVWQRQFDGRWLMHLDIWNNSPPPQP